MYVLECLQSSTKTAYFTAYLYNFIIFRKEEITFLKEAQMLLDSTLVLFECFVIFFSIFILCSLRCSLYADSKLTFFFVLCNF